MFHFFEKLIAPFPDSAPPRHFTSLFDFIRQYSRGALPYLLIMAMLSAIIAVLEVSVYRFLGMVIDWMSASEPKVFLDQYGDKLMLMALLILGVMPLTVAVHAMLSHQTLLPNFPMRIRWLGHKHLLKQSYGFYQNEFAGRLATKLMQTSLAVRDAVLRLMDVGVYVSVYFTSILVIVASLDLWLALPFFVWLAVYASSLRYFLPKLHRVAMVQADARSDMTGRIVDTYTNIATVKLFSHSHREFAYAREGMNTFLSTVFPQMRLVSCLIIFVWLNNIVLLMAVAYLAISLWLNSQISTGAIAASVGMVLRLFGMSQWIMWELSSLFEHLGTAQDGMNTFGTHKEINDKTSAVTLPKAKGKIHFNQVRFNYAESTTKTKKPPVLNDFSLTISAGEKIGLVGKSGAGKSTLVNLLLRFYDIEKGAITIDGHDLREVSQDSLREQIGMVTQDTSLLHRSVRENLIYGNPEADDASMIAAAKQARAHDFILDLKDNKGRCDYDAHVGERGVKLSGGQRQRIAIARVLLKNAPILILDEATSALDSEVEAAIQENLRLLMKDKTVIAIAHRLSTIANLDRLVVLDKGNIVEMGTHGELVRQEGLYAKLWKHQSGGFIGAE